MSNWECLRCGHETQRAAGFPPLQRGRETLRAAGFTTLKRANEKDSRILLDATDKEYGFQCASGALPTSIELRCGRDDCQQSLPPDPDPRYTSTGEYLAKVICKCWKNGHIAHSGCSHRSGLSTPQDALTEYVSRRGVVKKIKRRREAKVERHRKKSVRNSRFMARKPLSCHYFLYLGVISGHKVKDFRGHEGAPGGRFKWRFYKLECDDLSSRF
jgi:hypothetical protein